MWCLECQIETVENICPICGSRTVDDIPTDVQWCAHCRIPVQQEITQLDFGVCPICHAKLRHLSSDLRPVFPEERLLLELLLDKEPFAWKDTSVWAADSRYYIDGKAYSVSTKAFLHADADRLGAQLKNYQDGNSYDGFNAYIELF